MLQDKKIFYDYDKILSYNAFLNFLIRWKTELVKLTGITKFVINRFIKKGEQFAYIRRYKSELKKSVSTFFDSMIKNDEFVGHNLSHKGNTFYVDEKTCGFAMTLSTAQDLKSSNFDNVKFIIFDEFIIEPRPKKVLPSWWSFCILESCWNYC